MSRQSVTAFRGAHRGRTIHDNDPEGRPAPRLFLGLTAAGYVIRFSETVPDAVVNRVTEIVARRPPIDITHVPPEMVAMLRETLEQHLPITKQGGGPAYRFPEPIVPPRDVIELTDVNVAVARETYPWLERELADWHPCFAVVRDGVAVSICFSSRIGPVVCGAGVDTLPAFRGRGYASRVTAAWASAVRASGRIPLYSTTWDNLASQGVARRLGLIMYGSDVMWS